MPALDPELIGTPVQDGVAAERSQRLSREHGLPPGQVPGFEIERQLGAGSYGSVWLARELKTGKLVAIKFYTRQSGLNWSLLSREVEKLARLYTSRNIVGLLDVGWDHDPPYFVMEYLPAGSVAERLQQGPLSTEHAVRVATGVARALVHAHRSGILHCDVKPANILLDAELEPRLGDFGQSRLTTEHSPSLGTLFYMPPEQAVLEATPDVRWDVYALGALLHHLLTGAPPYASPAAEERLRSAGSLPQRLDVYRALIQSSPPPTAHRERAGVDGPLAELIDGCLERDPQRRLPSMERVLDLLERRERTRFRRPLMALGFLGPILFLAAMYWIAERSIPRVVAAAEQNLVDRALAGDGVSARILAESVQQELRSREAVLLRTAADPDVRRLIELSSGVSDERLLQLCLGEEDSGAADATAAAYRHLREHVLDVEQQLAADDRTPDDSWFVTDARGRQVFRQPAREAARPSTLGKPFHWRDYFHGLGRELETSAPLSVAAPRTRPGLSIPFRSQATGEYMVAIAVPVRDDDGQGVIGVLARTIRLTALLQQWEVRLRETASGAEPSSVTRPSRFLALADTRGEKVRLLDHPGMSDAAVAPLAGAEFESLLTFDAAAGAELQSALQSAHYRDPLADRLPAFAGEWLAAAAPVGATGWLAIVQERRELTVQPVDNLRQVFQRAGFWALGVFAALLLVLWFLIRRAAE